MTRKHLLSFASGLMLVCTGCAGSGSLVERTPQKSQMQQQQVQFDLARLSEKQGKLQQAQEMYLQLQQQNPNDARPLHRLGVIAAKLGQPDAANYYFMAALRNAPHNSDVLTDLGYSLYLQNDLDGAETALRQARKENITNQRALNNLAMVVGAKGHSDESYNLFRQVVGEAEATSNLAYIQARTGDLDRATHSYSQALTLNEDLDKASTALLQIAERDYLARQRTEYEVARAAERNAAPAAPQAPLIAAEEPFARPIQPASSGPVRVMLDDPVRPAVASENIDYNNIPTLESIETIPEIYSTGGLR